MSGREAAVQKWKNKERKKSWIRNYSISEKNENETKEQLLSMLLGSLAASLLGNAWTGK